VQKEPNNENAVNEEITIDPIGFEPLLSIFSLVVSIVSLIHDFGLFPINSRETNQLEDLYREVLRLQNVLDDLILTFHRYKSKTGNEDLEQESLSLSSTLFDLNEREYYRWLDLQDRIQEINQNVYSLISKMRLMNLKHMKKSSHEIFSSDLFTSLDELILRMGEIKFAEFIRELRLYLDKLQKKLYGLIHSKK
jgi:hypothetical protein